jgi:hypothetical protein
MGEAGSSETSVSIYQITRRHISENKISIVERARHSRLPWFVLPEERDTISFRKGVTFRVMYFNVTLDKVQINCIIVSTFRFYGTLKFINMFTKASICYNFFIKNCLKVFFSNNMVR